jgi:predicted dehydrogenase
MPEHSLVARAGLEAGKHVLVEKPMAVSLAEAANLVEIAKGSPGYLVPAPHVILSPTYQTMWRRIHRGDIGKVLMARARYGWAGPSWGKWFYQPGGGSMFDLGVYNVISLTGWLGPVKRVTAMVGTVIPERIVDGELMKIEADDTAHILLDFGGAVFAVVTTGFTMQRYRSPAIELYGSEGTIQMMGDDWRPRGYELWQNDAGAWQIFEDTDIYWQWTDGLRHLVECINSGTRPIITPEHGYHALEIMLKAQEAGRDGQAKEIESTFTPPDFSDGDKEIKVHLMHDRSY